MPTDTFSPTAVTEALDRRGLLDGARAGGTYALELAVPDDAEAAHREWLAHFDVLPGDDAISRMASAQRVAYVGASANVYGRLMDHADGDVRKAAVLEAFAPQRVIGVWPDADPFTAEVSRALALVGDGWLCWCNGQLFG